MRNDVPPALTDAEAEALYDALDVLRLARVRIRRIEHAHREAVDDFIANGDVDPGDVTDWWSDDEKAAMKSVYSDCCDALLRVWEVLRSPAMIEMLSPFTPAGLAEKLRKEEHSARRGQKKTAAAKSP